MLPDLYCDLDGVLVNFDAGARKAFGKPFDDESLGNAANKWNIIELTVTDFWQTLDWMPQGKVLWSRIRKYNAEILSACPPGKNTCPGGKRAWCKRHLDGLNPGRIHTVPRNQKKNYALLRGKKNVLIDDMKSNTTDWERAGGVAILHKSIPDTMSQLTKLGFI